MCYSCKASSSIPIEFYIGFSNKRSSSSLGGDRITIRGSYCYECGKLVNFGYITEEKCSLCSHESRTFEDKIDVILSKTNELRIRVNHKNRIYYGNARRFVPCKGFPKFKYCPFCGRKLE